MPGHRPLQFFLALSLLSPVLIASLSSQELTPRPLRPEGSREASDVVSRQILTPPLHGTTMLRFSPDGRHFLLQDASGLFVVSREPFRVVFYADAPDPYSRDFQTTPRPFPYRTSDLVHVFSQRINHGPPENAIVPIRLHSESVGARIAERRFSEGIAYAHFSSTGDPLFVLTDHQEAIVLDVKKMVEASANSATENR